MGGVYYFHHGRIDPDVVLYLEKNMTTLLLEKLAPTNLSYQSAHTWADPNATFKIVNQKLIGLNPVSFADQDLRLGTWNAEYLNINKAEHFLASYRQIVIRHHLLALQEIDFSGINFMANLCNYNFCISSANSRGQAVGFLIHPRFLVTNTVEYPEITNIFGIHDLRPALRIDLFDRQTKIDLSIITVHLKSMLGGLPRTGPVRKKQLQNLVNTLKDLRNESMILGDFNCFLDSSHDIDPLLNDGFILANPGNHTSTQSHGGRLDGLLHKGFSANLALKNYNIRNFWRTDFAGRSLSDHGLLTWKLAS
jgi:hypothetical protein